MRLLSVVAAFAFVIVVGGVAVAQDGGSFPIDVRQLSRS
jgi:hypothetical protein